MIPFTEMENETQPTQWGEIIIGILWFVIATAVGTFCLLMIILQSLKWSFVTAGICIISIVIGTRHILRGINFKLFTQIGSDKAKPNSRPSVIVPVGVAFIVTFILRQISFDFLPTFGMNNHILIDFLGPPIFEAPFFIINWFTNYLIINKPLSLLKKVALIIIVFFVIQMIAYIPTLIIRSLNPY